MTAAPLRLPAGTDRPRPRGTLASLMQVFAHHGRTFYFAARLLPAADRARVAAIYAYCRLTDDLVDEQADLSPAELHCRLDAWLDQSRAAYEGAATGTPAVDRAMRDMRDRGIDFHHAEELIAGMRSDVDGSTFETMADLYGYTYKVAGVVGLWMTEAFGVRDPEVLARAVGLGHAMQLTNIVRDVGEDWRRGRVYLPATLMRSYGLTAQDIGRMACSARPIVPGYRALLEAIMATADVHYAAAFEAMPALPPAFRRSVAVAAEVYRGIHAEVRRLDYDSLRRRAFTSRTRKVVLAHRGLRRLAAVRGYGDAVDLPNSPVRKGFAMQS